NHKDITLEPRDSTRRWRSIIRFGLCVLLAPPSHSLAAQETGATAPVSQQSLDDAWWTGPILAAGAGTLPQGGTLIEPYLFDTIRYGRYDRDGNERSASRTHSFGSLTYILHGV